jgi:hypothetical protein
LSAETTGHRAPPEGSVIRREHTTLGVVHQACMLHNTPEMAILDSRVIEKLPDKRAHL